MPPIDGFTSDCLSRISRITREQRGLGRPNWDTGSPRHIWLGHHFQGQKVKGQLAGAWEYCGGLAYIVNKQTRTNAQQACYFHSHSFPQPTPGLKLMADSENTNYVYKIQMIVRIDVSSSLQAKALKRPFSNINTPIERTCQGDSRGVKITLQCYV